MIVKYRYTEFQRTEISESMHEIIEIEKHACSQSSGFLKIGIPSSTDIENTIEKSPKGGDF
jgi:hypothetical protein